MHVSIVPTGPPRHGKNGFTVAGACPAIWSSTCFLAASFMPSPMPPIKDAIASRKKLEVSIARYCENADATRRLEPKPPADHNSQQHDLSSVLYIIYCFQLDALSRSLMMISNAGNCFCHRLSKAQESCCMLPANLKDL